jgi:tetratricopeptide (TPR) repeat protein
VILSKTKPVLTTLAYASPERLGGERGDVRSDVYSLGAVLYETLTGKPPFISQGMDRARAELLIREQPAPLPSAEIRGRTDVHPPTWTRAPAALWDGIDRIVLHAMEKDPARRYRSVKILANDLRRCIEGARIRTVRYDIRYALARRLQAGIPRHALLFLLLATLLGGAALLWGPAHGALGRLLSPAEENARGEKANHAADDLRRLLTTQLAIDPRSSLRRTAEVERELDHYAELVARYSETDPIPWSGLEMLLGRLYREYGFYDRAELHLQNALAVRSRVLGPDDLDTIETIHDLALLRYRESKHEAGLEMLRLVLRVREAAWGPGNSSVALTLNDVALIEQALLQYDKALVDFQSALERLQNFEPENPEIPQIIQNIAAVLRDMGRLQEAEQHYRLALDALTTQYGNRHLDVARVKNNLGELLTAVGSYDEAAQLLEQALIVRRNLLENRHPEVIYTIGNLGILAVRTKRFPRAIALLGEAVGLAKSLERPLPGLEAKLRLNLAAAFFYSGDLSSAEQAFGESAARLTALSGPDHPDVATAMSGLAVIRQKRGDLEGAESAFRDLLALRARVLGDRHQDTATTMYALGKLLTQTGQYSEASELLTRSFGIRKEAYPEDHPAIRDAAEAAAIALMHHREFKKALSLLEGLGSTLQDSPSRSEESQDEISCLIHICRQVLRLEAAGPLPAKNCDPGLVSEFGLQGRQLETAPSIDPRSR